MTGCIFRSPLNYLTKKCKAIVDKTVFNNWDDKECCRALDVTAVAGLSYTFANSFVVSARYGLGVTKIGKNETIFEKSKNSLIQLSIGYKF